MKVKKENKNNKYFAIKKIFGKLKIKRYLKITFSKRKNKGIMIRIFADIWPDK